MLSKKKMKLCVYLHSTGHYIPNLLTITNSNMTETKEAFEKRELKALFREILKQFAATIPEIGNQENAFNDAIPYLHRIFSENNDNFWELQELFYEFED